MEAKKILAAFFILLSFSSFSQSIAEQRKGHLRTQANLAGGFMFSQKDFRTYLTGDFDLFIDRGVSITGEGWFNFKSKDKYSTGLLRNHSFFGGFNYHPVKKGKWDPYIGLSPGIAMVNAREHCAGNCPDNIPPTVSGVAPLVSGVVGCNYYIGSVFNLFVKVRGVTGRFKGDLPELVSLHEMKITAGLGWNVSD